MVDEHFTFLGYREYTLSKRGKQTFLDVVEGSGLGILSKKSSSAKTIELTAEMQRLARSRDWLILTKANSRSTVHRSAFLDYVGVKMYDEEGNPIGERRFIGLLTSIAYSESPRNIPLIRHKVRKIFERAHVEEIGHRGKALLHIIETYPREELFQSSIQDLTRTTVGILNLQDRSCDAMHFDDFSPASYSCREKNIQRLFAARLKLSCLMRSMVSLPTQPCKSRNRPWPACISSFARRKANDHASVSTGLSGNSNNSS
jgi:NAD-specific glutamate dehydrogenase